MNQEKDNARSRASDIRQMFSRIAPAYDFLNHLLSLGLDIRWRRRAARSIEQGQIRRGLDLCGGTGDMAWEVHSRIPEASITIADFSLPMLSRAQQKFFPRRAFSLVQCDALELPFPSENFDLATCAFGLRNLVDADRGLREIHRVLNADGQLVLLEFMGRQKKGILYRFYRQYFRRLLPLIGRLVSGDKTAYRYLPDSVQQFSSVGELRDKLEQAGFEVRRCGNLTLGICTLFFCRKRGGTQAHP